MSASYSLVAKGSRASTGSYLLQEAIYLAIIAAYIKRENNVQLCCKIHVVGCIIYYYSSRKYIVI